MTVKTLIEQKAHKLITKYSTRDPFEIAEHLGIKVMLEDLGEISGYYNTAYRLRMIHINCNLDDPMRAFTAAHELGHAVLHAKSNTAFLRQKTYFSIDKFELQANQFAAALLISDCDIRDHAHLTSEQFSRMLGYPKTLVDIRLEQYKTKK